MIPQFEPLILDEYANTVFKQIKSGWIGPGKKVTEFEKYFAEYTNSKYATAVTSGTAALMIAMYGLNSGDEVILPDYSFIAAVNVVKFFKATPVFVDIKPSTLCMNPDLIEEKITEKTKFIVFINHNGYVGEDVKKIRLLCDNYNITMIEDAACALGQRYEGSHAGTTGHIGTFSFSVPKIITTGQGGMIVTNIPKKDLFFREMVDQGSTTWREDGLHKNIGVNFKFNDILASYGLLQLKLIDRLLSIRYFNFMRYRENGIGIKTYKTDNKTGTWMNVWVAKTEEIALKTQKKLKNAGFQSKFLYKPPHIMFDLDDSLFPVSSDLYRRTLYLPSSLTLTIEDIDKICNVIINE